MNYTLKSILGEGGMAIVHLAEDHKFHTEVAVKMLKKEFVSNENIKKRFLAEARSMFRMSHPHVIRVSDLIDEGDTVAFVMEYVKGETLKEYLERKGALPENEVSEIFYQMLDAVGYVHEQKLVHRDIKPSNFMIDKKGKVKLMDFGIAKNTDVNAAEYTQTGTGMMMGTPMYMSPEQITETKSVTAQSDIYSLGVVLWQLATGLKPYDTQKLSTFELQTLIVKKPLGKTNSSWDILIQKATEKVGINRYQTCADFTIALNQLFKKQRIRREGSISIQSEDKTAVEKIDPKKSVPATKQKRAPQKPLVTSRIQEEFSPAIPKRNPFSWMLIIVFGLVFLGIGILIFNLFFNEPETNPFGNTVVNTGVDDENEDYPQGVLPPSVPRDVSSSSGDFNGDGQLDWMWLEGPTLTANKEGCVGGDCVSFIRFSDSSIPEIKVYNSIGGSPENLGDLNSDGTHEIGLYPGWFSSCWREYYVWTFKNATWEYAVDPINTNCEQWDKGIRPIEIDPSKNGNVIIRYSELDDDFNIVNRSKSIPISYPESDKKSKRKN